MNDSCFKPGDNVVIETSGGRLEGKLIQLDTDDFKRPIARVRCVHDDRIWAGDIVESAWWLK